MIGKPWVPMWEHSLTHFTNPHSVILPKLFPFSTISPVFRTCLSHRYSYIHTITITNHFCWIWDVIIHSHFKCFSPRRQWNFSWEDFMTQGLNARPAGVKFWRLKPPLVPAPTLSCLLPHEELCLIVLWAWTFSHHAFPTMRNSETMIQNKPILS